MSNLMDEYLKIVEFVKRSFPEQWKVGARHRNEGGGNAPGPLYWCIDQIWRDFHSYEHAFQDFLATGGTRGNLDPPCPQAQSFATAMGITSITVDLKIVVGSSCFRSGSGDMRHATFSITREGKWSAPLPGLPSFDTLDLAIEAVKKFWADEPPQSQDRPEDP